MLMSRRVCSSSSGEDVVGVTRSVSSQHTHDSVQAMVAKSQKAERKANLSREKKANKTGEPDIRDEEELDEFKILPRKEKPTLVPEGGSEPERAGKAEHRNKTLAPGEVGIFLNNLCSF